MAEGSFTAISYSLVLDTTEPLSRVAKVLRDAGKDCALLGPSVTVEDVLDGCVTTHGTWIRVADGTPSLPWDEVEESFGFPSRVDVVFRLGPDHLGVPQEDHVIRLVAAVLDGVPEDAVRHFQQEMVWLVRRNGELEVSERSDLWPSERLALLTPPYRRRVTHHFV